MKEIYYKIGDVADMLGIEQYTLRYLENSLKLKIKRDERGDRLYTETDLETLRLILKLKNEKGLNTTAIKMALENMEEARESSLPIRNEPGRLEIMELSSAVRQIIEQNAILIKQNSMLQEQIKELETKIARRDQQREEKIDELIRLWRNEQEDRSKSWLAKLKRGK